MQILGTSFSSWQLQGILEFTQETITAYPLSLYPEEKPQGIILSATQPKFHHPDTKELAPSPSMREYFPLLNTIGMAKGDPAGSTAPKQ